MGGRCDLAFEIDAREIPAEWSTGYRSVANEMASRSGSRQAGGRLPRAAQTYRSADAERLGHTAIYPVQIAFGKGNCEPAVAGMDVIAGVVKQLQQALQQCPAMTSCRSLSER